MKADMKSVALPLCVIAFAAACLLPAADLGNVHTVYLLPMANGFEQHLANHLAASGVFQVVVDPKKADAVFTDRLGEAFELRLRELLADPAAKKDAAGTDKNSSTQINPPTSFGRGKGTVFLVETAGRSVVWSVYEPPRDSTAKELDRAAKRLVDRLKTPAKK